MTTASLKLILCDLKGGAISDTITVSTSVETQNLYISWCPKRFDFGLSNCSSELPITLFLLSC